MPGGSVYLARSRNERSGTSQPANLDIHCHKRFTPYGILNMRSLPPHTFTFPLTPPLMAREITESEKIEVRLHNTRMLVEHSTSSHGHHFARLRMDSTRGLQEGQSPVHCFYIHRKFSEIKSLSSEGKRTGNSNHILDSNYRAEKEEVRATTQGRGDSIELPKGNNRKFHRGGIKCGDWNRIQLELGTLSSNPIRREAASDRIPRAQ
jgi:hypothetical protein